MRKNNWTLEDYKAHYNERVKTIKESFTQTKINANAQAWEETFDLFMKQETPCDEEIREFRRRVK